MTSSIRLPESVASGMNASVDRSRISLAEKLIFFFIAFTFIFLASSRFINLYDEGIILTGANQMQRGLVIHRDFYANYGPAQFWLLSKFFDILGTSVLIERIYDILIRSALALMAYVALIAYARKSVARLAAALIVAWLGTAGSSAYPMYPALALVLASTSLLPLALAGSAHTTAIGFACGLFSGCAFLFKYDVGIYGILAQFAFIFFAAIFINGENQRLSQKTILTAAAYFTGVALPIVVLLGYFQANGAMQGFIHDIFTFSARHYSQTRGLPMPSVWSIVVNADGSGLAIYLPLLAIGLVIASLRITRSQQCTIDRLEQKRHLFIWILVFLTVVFFMRGIVRASVDHIQVALIPSILLLFIAWPASRSGRPALLSLWLLAAVLFLFSTASSAFQRIIYYPTLGQAIISGVSSTDYWFFIDPQRVNAMQFIFQNTSEDEPIFIGAGRHDKIFANDVSMYFLAQRKPATHWYQFDPGLQSSQEIQEKMVNDLEESKPRLVWQESTWDNMNEPNTSALSQGVLLLDRYLAEHYVAIATFGTITILIRR